MPFVIDASVAASWLLPDEEDPVSQAAYRRLETDDAIVPGLWWFEMRNILIVSERRGRIDSRQTARAASLLGALPIRLDFATEEGALMDLARRHRLTVYDAAYLELALRERLSLATLDDALRGAAQAEGSPLIGEEGRCPVRENRPKRYILTGAPGAGKTVILRALERSGHVVIEEAATDVIALEQARGRLEPHLDPGFIDEITTLQKARQIRADDLPGGLRIFDRSPICTAALCGWLGRPIPAALAEELARIEAEAIYEKQAFLIENLGFVAPTAARRISFADSLRFEAVHREAYLARGLCVPPHRAGRCREPRRADREDVVRILKSLLACRFVGPRVLAPRLIGVTGDVEIPLVGAELVKQLLHAAGRETEQHFDWRIREIPEAVTKPGGRADVVAGSGAKGVLAQGELQLAGENMEGFLVTLVGVARRDACGGQKQVGQRVVVGAACRRPLNRVGSDAHSRADWRANTQTRRSQRSSQSLRARSLSRPIPRE